MNLIDNGVKEIVSVRKVVTDIKCCFVVTFIDWYGRLRAKEVMDLAAFEGSTWTE